MDTTDTVQVFATSERDSFCRDCNQTVRTYRAVEGGRRVIVNFMALPVCSAGFVGLRRVLTFNARDLHARTCREKGR